MKIIVAASLIVSGLFLSAPAGAQGTAPAPAVVPGSAASAPAMKAAEPKADRTAKSKDCSLQADKKDLHGKARKAFRSKCKHG